MLKVLLHILEFIDSISKGDFEEQSEDLKKILGREPENLRDTIPKVLQAVPA